MRHSHGWLALLLAAAALITACSSSSSTKKPSSGASHATSGRSTLTIQISSAGGAVAGKVAVDGAACTQRICHYAKPSGSHVTLVESTISARHPFVKWQVDGTTMQGHSIGVVMARRYVYVNAIFRL